VQQKIFRIEQWAARQDEAPAPVPDYAEAQLRHYEVLAELQTLRQLLEQRGPSAPSAAALTEMPRAAMSEFAQLKQELDIVYQSISRTKEELAALHLTHFDGNETARVTRELGAVVGGTEEAAQQILTAAEHIDSAMTTLTGAIKEGHEERLQDIQNRVMQIFEACAFQDLTGQRIGKVLATLRFIEAHILRMMEIWGGLEALKEFTPKAKAEHDEQVKLIHGPKLADEPGHVSQSDVDAMFEEARAQLPIKAPEHQETAEGQDRQSGGDRKRSWIRNMFGYKRQD